jgi:hypothetical protein
VGLAVLHIYAYLDYSAPPAHARSAELAKLTLESRHILIACACAQAKTGRQAFEPRRHGPKCQDSDTAKACLLTID